MRTPHPMFPRSMRGSDSSTRLPWPSWPRAPTPQEAQPDPPDPEWVLPPPPRRRRVCSGEQEVKRPWRWVGNIPFREHCVFCVCCIVVGLCVAHCYVFSVRFLQVNNEPHDISPYLHRRVSNGGLLHKSSISRVLIAIAIVVVFLFVASFHLFRYQSLCFSSARERTVYDLLRLLPTNTKLQPPHQTHTPTRRLFPLDILPPHQPRTNMSHATPSQNMIDTRTRQ
mmetsp:Transcript_10397/g.19126  ORF Transcript_10397/g.19126 Transcript_10397/m.19126 type:complete len:225 (-) Transcript_10397:342-1016(-)